MKRSQPLRRNFVFLSLLGITEMAVADWQQIISTYQSIGYVDRDSLQRSGDITAMHVLIDYEKPPFDGNNLSYRSLTLHSEYNCATRQFRTLTLTSHAGNMATGAKPYRSGEPGEWQTPPAKSIQEEFWKEACNDKRAIEETHK